MPRFAALVEYDGSEFSGFQRQKYQFTVQEAIENALQTLQPDFSYLTGAGRTDSGVHALGQVIHFDMLQPWNPDNLTRAVNGNLHPHKISILKTVRVDDRFHARFSAQKRTYLYRIVSRSEPLVFESAHIWQVHRELDLEAMQDGARYLTGKHDFTTFRSTHCQSSSPVKTLDSITIEKLPCTNGWEFRFTLKALSFLHKQVRSIVGTLERVGVGKWAPDDVKAVLLARNRKACGPLASPQGLFLQKVDYEPNPFEET